MKFNFWSCELPTINDRRTLLSKRSARKGTITRMHHDLGLDHASKLSMLDTYDIQEKLDTVLKNQKKFELIQARVEQVANPEELKSDEATLKDQRAGISTVRKMMETTLKAHEFHVEGKCLYEDLEEFAACRDFSNPQVFTLLQSFEQRHLQLRRTTYAYEVFKDIQDLMKLLKSNLASLRSKVEEAVSTPTSIPMVSTPRSGTAREPTQDRSKLEIELPTLSGDPLQWNKFWKLFSRLIDKETDITDEEKTYFLIQSMRDSESETCARSAATYSDSYSSVVEALQRKYDRPRANYILHFKSFLTPRKGEYTRRSMEELVKHFNQI